MKFKLLMTITAQLVAVVVFGIQKEFTIYSPNGKLYANILIDKTIEYSIYHNDDLIISPSSISMNIGEDNVWGINPKLKKSSKKNVDDTIQTEIYKKSEIRDMYNELTLYFHGGYNVIFRAYDEAIAYRFVKTTKSLYTVFSEQSSFCFPENNNSYIAYVASPNGYDSHEDQLWSSFENIYTYTTLSEWDPSRLALLPILVKTADGKNICITEADLMNYPSMYLRNKDGNKSLEGYFAQFPAKEEQGGHNMLEMMVTERKNYIAKGEGKRSFPWRVIIISEKDYELVDNDTVYKLASASSGDFSWVKPGKVAWEWWNSWNLFGVDFETGINNETYKYYIDFASLYGIEYIILDEGWAISQKADLMQVVPTIDLPMLVEYGKKRNVGIILWAGYWAFDRDMENVCNYYSQLGIKGFKVDFMDRDDQKMVNFHLRAAETAARYGLILDFHGTYKPTGLQRTYPNVVNFEGVFGLENMKVASDVDQVTYDVIAPFIRQVSGPMDYTQGAMRNASRQNYKAVFSEPMSQGTRCRQLAQYIIFESPLNMLCDSPSNYMLEPEYTSFIADIPTIWDETKVLDGKVGEYIIIARRKGTVWYIGAMTNWNAREIEIDFCSLFSQYISGEIFRDGINADKVGRDYRKENLKISHDLKTKVLLAPGGGCVIKINL